MKRPPGKYPVVLCSDPLHYHLLLPTLVPGWKDYSTDTFDPDNHSPEPCSSLRGPTRDLDLYFLCLRFLSCLQRSTTSVEKNPTVDRRVSVTGRTKVGDRGSKRVPS